MKKSAHCGRLCGKHESRFEADLVDVHDSHAFVFDFVNDTSAQNAPVVQALIKRVRQMHFFV